MVSRKFKKISGINPIALSDSSFFRKILGKYRQGRGNHFRFPMMIFYRNAGNVLSQNFISQNIISQNFNFKILSGLYFDGEKKSSVFVKNMVHLRILIPWHNFEKIIRQFIKVQSVLKNIHVVAMKHGKDPGDANVIIPEDKLSGFPLLRTIRSLISISYPQTTYNNIQHWGSVCQWISNYPNRHDVMRWNVLQYSTGFEKTSPAIFPGGYVPDRMTHQIGKLQEPLVHNTFLQNQIAGPRMILSPIIINDYCITSTIETNHNHIFNKSNFERIVYAGAKVHSGEPKQGARYLVRSGYELGYRLLFDNRSIAILSKNNPIFFRTYGEINSFTGSYWDSKAYRNYAVKHYALNIPITSFADLKTIYNSGGCEFHFHKHNEIEQAVEQVKKIASQVKEVVINEQKQEQHTVNIKNQSQIDINRISDEVYHRIDCRLKMEKERRGLV